MSNRIINIQNSLSVYNKNNGIYIDVNMMSRYNAQGKKIDREDYWCDLVQENDYSDDNNITTEEDKCDIELYYNKNRNYYKDIDGYYKYRVDTLIDVKSVMNSLTNIFTWLKGERIINPEFGSDLRRLLYEGITPITEERIVAEINQCVNRWEPRVTIQKIQNISTVNDTEDNTINLNIVFKIKGLDQTYNKTFQFSKSE